MLKNLLADFWDIEQVLVSASVPPTARAEELGLEQWIKLANLLAR